MRILILEDDVRERVPIFRLKLTQRPDVTLRFAETAQEAIIALSDGEANPEWAFDLIFLDHDLGGEQYAHTESKNTGSEVVRWMRSNLTRYVPIIVHSLNAEAARDMKLKLEELGMEVHYIPFNILKGKLDDPNFISQ